MNCWHSLPVRSCSPAISFAVPSFLSLLTVILPLDKMLMILIRFHCSLTLNKYVEAGLELRCLLRERGQPCFSTIKIFNLAGWEFIKYLSENELWVQGEHPCCPKGCTPTVAAQHKYMHASRKLMAGSGCFLSNIVCENKNRVVRLNRRHSRGFVWILCSKIKICCDDSDEAGRLY